MIGLERFYNNLKLITKSLDSLDIEYLIGGSFASSVYGQVRSTNDIDILANFSLNQLKDFLMIVNKNFYFLDEGILKSFNEQKSFNLISVDSGVKFDFFTKVEEFEISELKRSNVIEIKASNSESLKLKIATAEDVIIAKTRWYSLSNQQSARQLSDILSIIKQEGANIDYSYIENWTKKLNLNEIFQEIIIQAKA